MRGSYVASLGGIPLPHVRKLFGVRGFRSRPGWGFENLGGAFIRPQVVGRDDTGSIGRCCGASFTFSKSKACTGLHLLVPHRDAKNFGVSMGDEEVEAGASQSDNKNLVQGERIEQVFFRELQRARAANPTRSHANANINIVVPPAAGGGGVEEREQRDEEAVLPARGGATEECEQANDGERSGVVAVPARGEAVEEREQGGDGEQLPAVALPARGEEVEGRELQGGDGEQLQAIVLPARGEAVEEREQAVSVEEREQADDGTQLGAVALPASRGGDHVCEDGAEGDRGPPQQTTTLPATGETSDEREEGHDQPHAAQELLLPRCIKEEDCGPRGADECASERPRARPKRRAPPQSCGLIMGIIGIMTIFAVSLCIFVTLKLIPVPAQGPSVPPTAEAPTFLSLPSPTIASPAVMPAASFSPPPASPPPVEVVDFSPPPASPPPSIEVVEEMRTSLRRRLTGMFPRETPAWFFADVGSLFSDRNFVLAALEFGYPDIVRIHILGYVSPELQNDRAVLLAAVRRDGAALQFASSRLRADWGVVLKAVLGTHYAMQFVSKELKRSQQFVLAAVAQNGLTLKFVWEKFQADRDVVLAAVSQNGMALQFAAPEFQEDKEIFNLAISRGYDPADHSNF